MNLDLLKQIVIGIALVSLIAAATAIALDDFDDDLTANSYASNITNEGLKGLNNATSYLDTIGTIAGVAVLIGLVVGAFYFMQKQ